MAVPLRCRCALRPPCVRAGAVPLPRRVNSIGLLAAEPIGFSPRARGIRKWEMRASHRFAPLRTAFALLLLLLLRRLCGAFARRNVTINTCQQDNVANATPSHSLASFNSARRCSARWEAGHVREWPCCLGCVTGQ